MNSLKPGKVFPFEETLKDIEGLLSAESIQPDALAHFYIHFASRKTLPNWHTEQEDPLKGTVSV